MVCPSGSLTNSLIYMASIGFYSSHPLASSSNTALAVSPTHSSNPVHFIPGTALARTLLKYRFSLWIISSSSWLGFATGFSGYSRFRILAVSLRVYEPAEAM